MMLDEKKLIMFKGLSNEFLQSPVIVIFLSMLSVIINLFVSLKVIDITGSPTKQSFALFIYNIVYTFMSFSWRKINVSKKTINLLFLFLILILGLSSILLSFSNSYYLVLVAFAIFASSLSILNPLTISLISRRVKRESEISLKYNYYNSLGSTIGYLLAGMFVGIINLNYLLLFLVLVVLMNGLSLKGKLDYDTPKILTGPLPHHHSFQVIIDIFDKVIDVKYDVFYLRLFLRKLSLNLKRRYFLTELGIFVFFIGVGLFFTPLPSMLLLAGLSKRDIYLEYAFFNLFSVIGFQSLGYLNLTFEKMYGILSIATFARCVLFTMPVLIFLGFVEANLWFITALMILVGYTWAFLGFTMLGILLYLVPHSEKARAASSFNAITSMGTVIGSLLATLIVSELGIGYSYLFSGLFATIALALFLKARSAILS